MSEQSAGILPLLALAFWVGATVWEQVSVITIEPACVKTTGVDNARLGDDNRIKFDYPEKERCYE